MTRVLLTAFEPYDDWSTNASWMVIERLTHELPAEPEITTRRYPVDFSTLQERVTADLADDYDVALLLGQAPGRTAIDLEAIAVNVALSHDEQPEQAKWLVSEGPVAYRSELPLEQWAASLRRQGFPARLSFHAGTFLCNAALYLVHHCAQQMQLRTKAAFIHVPLDPSQVAQQRTPEASLPVEISTLAVRWMLEQLGTDMA